MLLLLALLLTASAEVVDRIELVVEDELIMTSDIRIDELLQRLDDSPSPFWQRAPKDPVARLRDAALVRHLAGEVAIYQPTDSDVRRRLDTVVVEHFENRAAWGAFLEQWGIDEASVRALLKRRMVVERYLARNLRASVDGAESWWAAFEALIGAERERARIRVIAPEGTP